MIHEQHNVRIPVNSSPIADDDEAPELGGPSLKDLGTIRVRLEARKGVVEKHLEYDDSLQLPGDAPISEKAKKSSGHAVRSVSSLHISG